MPAEAHLCALIVKTSLRIQLWSYNYAPEPTGIAPLSTVWATAMVERGHRVEVVAAHPHYPRSDWGTRLRPYRERREGIPVVRLPLWPGRRTAAQRLRQEASYTLALTLALPALSKPDVMVVVSPSFPALAPAMLSAAAQNVPWLLWLQDVLPDAAATTNILRGEALLKLARRFERAAYRSASRVIVISDSFAQNLRAKGVSEQKLVRIYNPASRPVRSVLRPPDEVDGATVLTMGNIGRTQNLAAVVRAFQDSEELAELAAQLVVVGDGVAADDVRAEIDTDRVHMTGLISSDALERELRRATVALVSQRYDGVDFNVPSKLMNFMGYAIPTVAAVRADSEVARIVRTSGAGWVDDSSEASGCAATLAAALRDPDGRCRSADAALRFAQASFTPDIVAEQFERALLEAVGA